MLFDIMKQKIVSEKHFDDIIEVLNACFTSKCDTCPQRHNNRCLLDMSLIHANPAYASAAANIFLADSKKLQARRLKSLLFTPLIT